MVWIGLVDEEHRIIRPVASGGYVDGYLDTVNISTENIPRGRGAIGTHTGKGKNIFVTISLATLAWNRGVKML